jgi:hypothetical protein
VGRNIINIVYFHRNFEYQHWYLFAYFEIREKNNTKNNTSKKWELRIFSKIEPQLFGVSTLSSLFLLRSFSYTCYLY